MPLVRGAMRLPVTVLVIVVAVSLGALLALHRMPVDIFPDLNLPVIYVAQTYGGMDPAQMEGYLVSYYEYHFLYIAGIEHVESRSIQNVGLIKLYFHPGTDMSQALAQTISYVERARAFMPAGTVAPFVMRFDAGSVPVGQLVFQSDTRDVGQIQDLALFRVRPVFATLPGVSAPPPFGGNQRTVVIHADPDKLRAYGMAPDELVRAVAEGNAIVPAGNVREGDLNRLAPLNGVVSRIDELEKLPIRKGAGAAVFLRDVATVENGSDVLTGFALVDGRRTVYIPVTKRADASTLDVVERVKAALPRMRSMVPEDIHIRFEFDQSVIVRGAIRGLLGEGALGAGLTGLMVLLFLGSFRSALIVVITIPFALLASIAALWLAGQTINLMSLGGLALAIGILVDEASVAIENIHTHLARAKPTARAVMDASRETATPRLLAMLCILAVFVPSFAMVGISRALFVPLALAVGFAMLASYLLSSTLVPILATWWLAPGPRQEDSGTLIRIARRALAGLLRVLMVWRLPLIVLYALLAAVALLALAGRVGLDIFPQVDRGQFQIRLRAPTGTRVERTEVYCRKALDLIRAEAGPDAVAITLGFAGTQPPSYPINSIYLWTSGSHEAKILVALRPEAHVALAALRERLRHRFAAELPELSLSFEAGDVVSQIMNFGAPSPIEVAVSGPSIAADRAFAAKVLARMRSIPSLRDLCYGQPQEYPTVDIQVDRERAGQLGLSVLDVGKSVVAATSSSRLVQPNFWRDPASGVAYQVQVEIPQHRVGSIQDVENVPLQHGGANGPRVGDVARVSYGATPGEYDRYNMQRMVTITANIEGADLGAAAREVAAAITRAGTPPRGVLVEPRGQVLPMRQTEEGLTTGIWISLGAILLLLTASFQSPALALAVLATIPAVLVGVGVALVLTGTTLNVQSFTGAIMAVGVSAANAILLVTFAEELRCSGLSSPDAAIEGATRRLRPVLMTTMAMVAGMIPMALALGEGGEQTAPLGRAVIGGLVASTISVLTIVPIAFSILRAHAGRRGPSLDPDAPGLALP